MSSRAATRIEDLPERFNAAADLLDARRGGWCADATAIIDRHGTLSYGELRADVTGMASLLHRMGIKREQRVLLCLADDRSFVISFLGAIFGGFVPVPVNNLLGVEDYRFLLENSRASLVIVGSEFRPTWADVLEGASTISAIWVEENQPISARLKHELQAICADSHRDEIAFWLYSSGSTGRPKAALHSHASLRLTANLFSGRVLGIRREDVVLSVAKLFFAYGLGNALTFPLAAGATTVLWPERPMVGPIAELIVRHGVTILSGVPTFYANWLAQNEAPAVPTLRLAVSAGEALPAHLGERFHARHGVHIIDGLGSTEMLHVFVSQQPGEVRYGATGRAVPGYDVKVIDERGGEVAPGVEGELVVRGPTAALGYWLDRPRSLNTFEGEWTHTRDRGLIDAEGWITHLGRIDDLLKVSGLYVSPAEVEAAICSHEAVIEAAVVGEDATEGLVKPIGYAVLQQGWEPSDELAAAIVAHVRGRIAPHKYPRRILFLDDLPKTTTGKVQRFRLRQGA